MLIFNVFYSVTSSEKVDATQKYSVFRIIPTPYPGCEFFHDFKKNNYNSEGLMFNWCDPTIDSILNVRPNPAVDQLDIQWSKYKVRGVFLYTLTNRGEYSLYYSEN